MKHYCDQWIRDWCDQNGWTDLFVERYMYWAFPPGAVMPEPIPSNVLRLIKAQKGFSQDEQLWIGLTVLVAIASLIISYLLISPMPLVFAFSWAAVVCATLEVEDY